MKVWENLLMLTKQHLQKLLKQHVVEIKFKKVDGSDRMMLCSLRKEYLPEQTEKKERKDKKENLNSLAVWDIEKDGFRSFRIDSVIDYEIVREEGYEL